MKRSLGASQGSEDFAGGPERSAGSSKKDCLAGGPESRKSEGPRTVKKDFPLAGDRSEKNSSKPWLLSDVENGLVFEHLSSEEATYLHHEIFVDESYARAGVVIKDGMTVVDVGANIGLFSMWCANRAANLRIVAIEAIPEIADCCERNLQQLRCRTVDVVRCAVGDSGASGETTCWFCALTPGESTRHPEERRTTILAIKTAAVLETTRDDRRQDFLAEVVSQADEALDAPLLARTCAWRSLGSVLASLERVHLLKVDIEGDELAALRGVGDICWAKIDQLVVEVKDVQGRLADVLTLLKKHFQHTRTIHQATSNDADTVEGDSYTVFLPPQANLTLVYARRSTTTTSSSSSLVAGDPLTTTATAR